MDGERAFEIIKKQYPNIKVIILSGFVSESTITYFMEKGANAVIAKEWSEEILLDAIYTVWIKGYYFNTRISQALLNKLQKEKNAINAFKALDLSDREIEVLKELLKGRTNKQVAESLNIVAGTVDFHRRRIYAKTNTDNISALTIYAIKNRIISLPD
jgi:DNA-binding NarL/FixJ family response regulator